MLFAIIVEFKLKEGVRPEFRRLIDANADASVRKEPGCLQFDVLEPEGEEDRVILYEIYRDRAAFDEHVKSEHFHVFDRQSKNLCLGKSVTNLNLVFSGGDVVVQRAG